MRGHVEEVRRQIETSVQQAFGQVGRIEELQEQIREQGRQLHEMREQIREQGQQLHEENLEMRGRLICGCLICECNGDLSCIILNNRILCRLNPFPRSIIIAGDSSIMLQCS